MKIEGEYWFEASVPEVWSALFDPVILAAVMPGCEKLDLVDGQYVGEIKVKVGPIQGKFTGKVDLKDKDEPHSYTMVVDGRGAPGFVKATAGVKLAPDGAGTRVFYDTDAQIGGKIASVGQRLIEASARAIVAQSLEGLHTNIKLRAAAYREAMASQPAAAAAEPAPAAIVSAPGDPVTTLSASPSPSAADLGPPAEIAAAASAMMAAPAPVVASLPAPVATPPVIAAPVAPAAPAAAAPAIAFTPVKTKQSALANAVAKEVASSLFPRSVLVGIIVLQALVIIWLAVRH
jgi:carbon monoxide dehydrogenase subunit G